MCSNRSGIFIIALFGLSLLLGIVGGVLNALGILTVVTGFVPLIVAISALVLLAALALAAAALLGREEDCKGVSRSALCECLNCYLRPIVISALIALVVALLFASITVIPILAGIVLGFILTFFFFALLLLGTLVFCLVSDACDVCRDR